jgi:hypothetical protein
MHRIPLRHAMAVLALGTASVAAHASCGSAFCTLMTDRYAQGTGTPHDGWSLDLRLESVTQDQLRSGTRNLDASQVTGEEAIERHTRNLNTVATLSYGISDDWSISLRLPFVKRDHLHDLFDPETSAIGPSEQWQFTKPGDVQVLARRQFATETADRSWAVFGGLKLPTGSTQVTNADGARAERALQPGSGTTDIVAGLAVRQAMGPSDALIGQAVWSQALGAHEDYKPGGRLDLSAGWSHAYSHSLGAVVQLNLSHRARDSGAQSEPDNSGSTKLQLSPGVTVGVGAASTLYAYLQLPLYQKVNGIQLVARRAIAVGWTSDF